MGNLFDLIAATARKAPAKPDTSPRRVELLVPAAANDPQAAAEPHHAPAAPAPLPTPAPAAEADSEPQNFIRTAATATAEWREARDQYHGHIFACPGCHPPTGRYCQTGAALRATYNATPWN